MKTLKKDLTKEQFLAASLKDISQVYTGPRNYCRCGCGGDYLSTTFALYKRSDVNDEKVEKKLKRAKGLVLKGANVDYGSNYVDVQTGKNRTLTFYFDDVRQ